MEGGGADFRCQRERHGVTSCLQVDVAHVISKPSSLTSHTLTMQYFDTAVSIYIFILQVLEFAVNEFSTTALENELLKGERDARSYRDTFSASQPTHKSGGKNILH